MLAEAALRSLTPTLSPKNKSRSCVSQGRGEGAPCWLTWIDWVNRLVTG